MSTLPNCATKSEWKVEDVDLLRRFLFTGSEAGNFHVEDKDQMRENVKCLFRLFEDNKGTDAVTEIVNFMTYGKLTKEKPAIFALALCAKLSTDLKTKQAAYQAVPKILHSAVHFFMFIEIAGKLKEKAHGWGRAQRNAVSDWYNKKKLMELSSAVTKHRQKAGWSHIDLLRLAHVKPGSDETGAVLRYVIKGIDQAKSDYAKEKPSEAVKNVLEYLEAVEMLKHSKDDQQAAHLIEKHHLVREQIPTWMVNSKEVWRSLIGELSLSDLLKQLGKLTALGLLDPLTTDSAAPLVLEKLKDDAVLKETKIRPFSVLLALKTYEKGKAEKGKLTWTPNGAIVDALTAMYYNSFKNISATKKRWLIAIDTSGSMQYGGVSGSPQITPAAAAATMAMQVARSEETYQLVGFSLKMTPVNLNAQMSLQQVCEAVTEVPMATMDVAQPMLWAGESKKNVDIFLIFTDCETLTGQVHPADALRRYRQDMDIPHARLVVCALTSSGFSMSDPEDKGMMDIAGFNDSTPDIIKSFSLGEL